MLQSIQSCFNLFESRSRQTASLVTCLLILFCLLFSLFHSLFERAVSSAGEEFRADKLWDAYIEWEKSQGQLQRVTALYDRVFMVPTQNYSQHFEK